MATTLLLATLAVRALVPLGYMPGNLLAGEFAELCPVASAATFALLGDAATHDHHHGDESSSAVSVGSACPIGTSLYFDALPALQFTADLQLQQQVLHDAIVTRQFQATLAAAYAARAPPSS